MSHLRRGQALVLALTLALGFATAPALAEEAPAPAPVREERSEPFPWIALAPVGLSAGYVYAGRWERVVLAPIVVYGAVGAGAMAGLAAGLDRATWKSPLGSFLGIVILPALGAGAAFGVGSLVVLIDQALLPHAGSPWAAPALTVATVGLLFYAHIAAQERHSDHDAAAPAIWRAGSQP